MPDLLDRPAPPRSWLDRARSWVEWVGIGRIVAGAIAVLAVLAGAYWLVKPPAATTESTLPFTSGAGAGSSTSAPADAPPSTVVSTSTSAPVDVVVHVAGAVVNPGVYRLPSGTRVIDAVDAAGGLSGDAQPDAVNLAAVLADGERVYLPRVGETAPIPVDSPSATGAVPSGPVNLNSATADELDALPGVGPATAAVIIAHREQHGPFASVDDLADVRGIGPAKLEALRGLVTV